MPCRWVRLVPPLALTCVLLGAPDQARAQGSSDKTAANSAEQDQQPAFETSIEVVAVTPIHGLGVARSKVPVNVQSATIADLERMPGADLTGVLEARAASVHSTGTQASTFQPDVQFRGFTASPILGLPQGVAIYQDGVRVNEPFGDTVNWDLLPSNAVASVNLTPGSNPLFGLNALGGALSIETRTGFSSPGLEASLQTGAFGRTWTDVAGGGRGERFAYFVAGRLLGEDGWRDFSSSTLRQIFGSVEWRAASTSITARVSAADNRLIGNGPAPVQLLEIDRSAIFTHRDQTDTRASIATLSARHTMTPQLRVDGLFYYRPARIRTFNGDDTNYGPCESRRFSTLMCLEGDDNPIVDQSGHAVPVGTVPLDATNNTSRTRSHGWGAGGQLTATTPLFAHANHFIAGASLDAGRSRYEAATELARLTATRGTEGSGIFDAGAAVGLRTHVRHASGYVADFFDVTSRLTVSGSARFTHSAIELRDQIGSALDGDHRFSRLNAAGGMTFRISTPVSAYANVSSASRVPTPSELSCADPEDPCRLPNAFVADPPLAQVTARSVEGGLRGQARSISWSAGTFRTVNRHDIVFVSSGALTNEGHFENVDEIRRTGFEVAASGTLAASRSSAASSPIVASWSAAYSFLAARTGTALTLSSPHHPDARDGEIDVPEGATLPLTPRHGARLGFGVARNRVSLDAMLRYSSSQYLRGDEANLLEPIGGYAALDLGGRYALTKRVNVVARAENLLGTRYSTFGLLGDATAVLGEQFDDPRFVSPGPPRAAWVGLELRLR